MRKSRRVSRKSRKPRPTRKSKTLPKTAKLPSKLTPLVPPRRFERASESMNMDELRALAKSRGIPFGGLSKTKLINKINNY